MLPRASEAQRPRGAGVAPRLKTCCTVDKQRGSSLEEAEPRVAPNRQAGRVGSPIPHVVVAARLRGRFETPLVGAGGWDYASRLQMG